MNVRDLRTILNKMPDKMEVVMPGPDHSYTKVFHAKEAPAENLNGDYWEYYDERNMFEGGVKDRVFLIA